MVLFYPGIHPARKIVAVMSTPQVFGRIPCIGIIFDYRVHTVLFNKNEGIDLYIIQGTL